MNQSLFRDTLSERPLVFDGAMGTMLMQAGLAVKTPILLNIEQPDLVADIHRQYFAAGADVVIANTFGGNPLKLAADGLEAQTASLNRAGVELAKAACPSGCFVAGDIGPSGKMLKPLGDIAPADMTENFSQQARLLMDAEVDLIAIETMFSLEEALAAVAGVRQAGDILLLGSMTFTQTKNGFFTMMGESVAQCVAALESAGVDMLGANCTLSSAVMIDLTKALRAATRKPVLIQPNAGKPVTHHGTTYYEQRAEEFAADAAAILAAGAQMIGGCCGTTPEFVQAIKKKIADSAD
jgi:5-methyltetrahydrofolate--homocysteine methyltransferase